MTLPRQNSAWVDGDGRPTRDLYNWARQVNITPQTGTAQPYALGELTNVSLSGISDGDVLTWSNTQGKWINSAPSGSSGGYSEGTSFPGSPTAGDKFYRTDLNWLCFYDGTRWMTCHEYSDPIAIQDLLTPWASGGVTTGYLPARRDYQMYLTRLTGNALIVGTNDASNYWTLALRYKNSANAATTITSGTTASFPPNVNNDCSIAINSTLDSSAFFIDILVTKTVGSPGALYLFSTLNYRLIVT